MTFADLDDLFGPDEHALYLGGLIGTTHPSFDPQVCATAWAPAGDSNREVADREPYPGVIRIKRGYDNLADIAFGRQRGGAGPNDFEDYVLVSDKAVARRCLVRN